jgi:hypothetical protein
VSPQTSGCENSAGAWSVVASVVGRPHIDRWDISALLIEPAVVEPVTHSAIASLASSMVRHGLRGLISSVLYRPLIVSASALSYELPTAATEA